MDAQEIKLRYQELLEAYHSGEIDWKAFESRLLELKRLRSALAASDGEYGDETPEAVSADEAAPPEVSPASDPSIVSESPATAEPPTQRSRRGSPDPATETGKRLKTETSRTGGSGRFEISFDDSKNFSEGRNTGSQRYSFDSSTDTKPSTRSSSRRFGSEIRTLSNPSDSTILSRSLLSQEPPSKPVPENGNGRRLNAGDVLAEGYVLQRLLGYGQCGETWRARELESEHYVVVKPIPPAIQNDPEAWKIFRNAFRRVSTLRHPNIVPVYQLESDRVFGAVLVSAFLDALPLDEYYERYCRSFNEFPVTAAVRILWPVGEALDRAHRKNVVHCDLKPQNILIGKRCGPMLADFLVTETVRSELERLGISTDAVDAAPWRAPEAWSSGIYVPASDQFSLGALAYELLTGSRPFPGNNSEETRERITRTEYVDCEDLSERQNAIFRKVFDKDPAKRYPSCLHFVRELAGDDHRGPHFDRLEEMTPQPKGLTRFWGVLFGLPAAPQMPAWLLESSNEELWPFKDIETTLDPRDGRIPKRSMYPYEGVSGIVPASPASSLLGPIAFLAGGLAAVAIGTAVVVNMIATPGDPSPGPGSDTAEVDTTTEHFVAGTNPARLPDIQAAGMTDAEWGKNVVSVDPSSLPDWERRAEQGEVAYQRQLGEAYYYGKGIKSDYTKAAAYFRQAAAQGDTVSLYHLGRCYELGLGLAKSPEQAVVIYREAARLGSERSREALKRLGVDDNSDKVPLP